MSEIEELVANGDWNAIHVLAGEHLVRDSDLTLAWSYFKAAAEGGFTESMAALGHIFLQIHNQIPSGSDFERDAVLWSKKGAELGDPDCMLCYGTMLLEGIGEQVDLVAAEHWLTKAVELGKPMGYLALGLGYVRKEDYATALQWLSKGAEAGVGECTDYIATMHYHGLGLPQNVEECERLRTARAEQSDANHKFDLGWMYTQGDGVPQDIEKANYWYRRAADEGSPEAMFNLGQAAINEENPPNFEKAMDWFEKAAELGHVHSMVNVGSFYANGQGRERDFEKTVFWYGKAVEAGDPQAMVNMGIAHAQGEGVEPSLTEAFRYFMMAAELGHPRAMGQVSQMYANGMGVDRNLDEAALWERRAFTAMQSTGGQFPG